jgi:hypothetical protein
MLSSGVLTRSEQRRIQQAAMQHYTTPRSEIEERVGRCIAYLAFAVGGILCLGSTYFATKDLATNRENVLLDTLVLLSVIIAGVVTSIVVFLKRRALTDAPPFSNA